MEEALRLWIVHVRSHSRHRQHVVTVMTLARVSMIVPLQDGHDVGRATTPEYESFMLCVISRESRGVYDSCWRFVDSVAVQD